MDRMVMATVGNATFVDVLRSVAAVGVTNTAFTVAGRIAAVMTLPDAQSVESNPCLVAGPHARGLPLIRRIAVAVAIDVSEKKEEHE